MVCDSDKSEISHLFFFFQAEDGIRDKLVTGVQTCALPISPPLSHERCQRTLPRHRFRCKYKDLPRDRQQQEVIRTRSEPSGGRTIALVTQMDLLDSKSKTVMIM